MITFKQFLIEGMGQVKRNFLTPGKIDNDDLRKIKSLNSLDLNGDYLEWLAKFMVDNEYAKSNTLNKKVYAKLKNILPRFDSLKNKNVVKEIPNGMNLEELEFEINSLESKYYANKKMDVGGLKEGVDYENFYFGNGFEILLVKTHKGIMKIGSGTKWCITSEWGQDWNELVGDRCFYVCRNNRVRRNDPMYKVAIQVQKLDNEIALIWDAKDNAYLPHSKEYKELFRMLEIKNKFVYVKIRKFYHLSRLKKIYDQLVMFKDEKNLEIEIESDDIINPNGKKIVGGRHYMMWAHEEQGVWVKYNNLPNPYLWNSKGVDIE